MKKILFVLALFITSSSFAAQYFTLIDTSNIPQKIRQQMLQQFPILLTGKTTRRDLDQVLQWLLAVQHYDNAWVESDESEQSIVIRTGLTRKVQSIQIQGVKNLNESDLLHELSAVEGGVFDKERILQGAEKIRSTYKDSGFFNAEIGVEFRPLKSGDYDVFVDVKENIQTKFRYVRVTTANPSLQKKLQKLADKKIGDPYTPINLNGLRKDLRTYLTENHFLRADLIGPSVSVTPDESGADVDFKVDKPESYFLETTGQDRISPSELKSAINFDDFVSTTPDVAQEVSQKARTFYVSQGFARVDIKATEEEAFDPFQRRIRLEIQEGPKIRIDKVEFTGRFSKPMDFYVDLLLDQGGSILSDRYFVKEDFDRALKNLIIDRRNNGFFKAKINSSRTIYNDAHDKISLYISMDEGPITHIQRISFENAGEFDDQQLLKLLQLNPQDPLRLNILEEGMARLKKFYHDNGFLEMSITNEKNENDDLVSYNEDNTLANLNFKFFEGPKVMVGSVVVEGNTKTKDYVILKELEFKTGDVLTPAKIEETKARLQRLGIFSTVEIKTLEEHTMTTRRTVLVNVADRDPGAFSAGVGATNDRQLTLRGYTGVAYHNLDGLARDISIRADGNFINDISFIERKVTAAYLQPYLFDTRLKGRVSFTAATFVSDFNLLTASDVNQTSFALLQELTSHIHVGWDLWDYANYKDYSAINNPSVIGDNVHIGSTGPQIELDFRDHPFNPTGGFLYRWAAEIGTPELLSDQVIRYWRTTMSYTQYWNVYKQVVWANSIRGGYLKNIDNASGGGFVPYDKKGFLLGGETTIRGFTNPEAFPNANDLNTPLSYHMQTESNMYLFKSEVRFPIKGNLSGAVFYDGGGVVIMDYYLPFTWRHAAGIGGRWNTPVGPLNVEIGWKLNTVTWLNRVESPYAIHVSIGTF